MRRFGVLLVAASLLVGGAAACGDDDDDDVDAAEETTDEVTDDTTEVTEPPFDAPAMSGATLAFCQDWIEPTDTLVPIEDVQTSVDLATAARSELPTDVADAVQVAIDLAQFIVDNDDGDAVVSDAEVQAAVEAFPAFAEVSPLIDEHCAPALDVSRNRQNDDG